MYDRLRETSWRLFNKLTGVVSCWTSTDWEEGRIGLEMFFALTIYHRWKVLTGSAEYRLRKGGRWGGRRVLGVTPTNGHTAGSWLGVT